MGRLRCWGVGPSCCLINPPLVVSGADAQVDPPHQIAKGVPVHLCESHKLSTPHLERSPLPLGRWGFAAHPFTARYLVPDPAGVVCPHSPRS